MKHYKYRFLIILIGAFLPLIILPLFFTKMDINEYLNKHNPIEGIYVKCDKSSDVIHLTYSEETLAWYAFLPAHFGNETIQLLHENTSLVITDEHGNTNPIIHLADLHNGDALQLSIAYRSNTITTERILLYQANYVPTLYINTPSGDMEYIHEDKTHRENVSLTLYQADGSLDTVAECVINGRGNSSWVGGMDGTGQKKPYNLKFDSPTSLLDMESQKKWALIACYDDQAYIRNKITFELAQKLELDYTPQAEYVNLYTNGKYKGLYLLAQRVDIAGGCVNISDGYLLEFDVRLADTTNGFHTSQNKISIKAPAQVSASQISYISEYVQEIEAQLFRASQTNSSNTWNYSDYIDIDSWAKMYVLQDFLMNFDVNYSSFYMYKKTNDPHLYAGPVWDFDLSMGNLPFGEYMDFTTSILWLEGNQQRLWLYALDQQKDFHDSVMAIYQTKFRNILDEMIVKDIPLWTEQLLSSAQMDALLWKEEPYNFKSKIAELTTWLINREQFFADYFTNPLQYNKATFQFDNHRNLIYCTKKGDMLNHIPTFEGYTWVDESGKEVNPNTILSNNTTFSHTK